MKSYPAGRLPRRLPTQTQSSQVEVPATPSTRHRYHGANLESSPNHAGQRGGAQRRVGPLSAPHQAQLVALDLPARSNYEDHRATSDSVDHALHHDAGRK
eukprot:4326167-Pyramimonas_sp.AAC.1